MLPPYRNILFSRNPGEMLKKCCQHLWSDFPWQFQDNASKKLKIFSSLFPELLTTPRSSSLRSCAAAAGMAQDETTNEHCALQPGDSQPIYAQIAHKKAGKLQKEGCFPTGLERNGNGFHISSTSGCCLRLQKWKYASISLFFQPAETKFQVALCNWNISFSGLWYRPSLKREGYIGVKQKEYVLEDSLFTWRE